MHHSYLYVPGDRPELLAKALAGPAGAVIIDLEDGVAADARAGAREAVALALAGADGELAAAVTSGRVLVRVHPLHLAEDLALVMRTGVRTIYLPKAQSSSLAECDAALSALATEHANADGDGERSAVEVVALIESADGLLQATELARHPRVVGLALGEADLCAELGVDPNLDEVFRQQLRMPLVIASSAGGLRGPTAPASTDYRDLDALAQSCELLHQMGFAARSAVHPAQIEVINSVFAPSAEELMAARRLVEAFDAALADGRGVMVGEDGKMIDAAVVRSARRLLE